MLRIVSDEKRARAVVDVIVETFDPAETAASAFEEPDEIHWAAEVYFAEEPDEEAIRELVAAATDAETAQSGVFLRVAEQDWVKNALEGLAPVRAGRVLVHGSHDRDKLRVNDIGVEIEAALAFGTGHHGTTRGCLLALKDILARRRPRRVLDVGTGTGVLAIAAARLLHQQVACGDLDPIAVDTAGANARANCAGAYVRPVVAVGVRHGALRGDATGKARYDLIFANILAKPLRLMAPSLAAVAGPDAELVLSGLLAKDVAGVLAAYRAQGFYLARRGDLEGWATLVLRRCGAGAARAREIW